METRSKPIMFITLATSSISVLIAFCSWLTFPAWAVCNNEKAGYSFSYPSNWNVYGDGSTDGEAPIAVRTTPCSGLGVSLRHDSLLDVVTPLSLLQGIDVRVDLIPDTIQVQNNTWSDASSKKQNIDGTIFLFIKDNNDVTTIQGIRNRRLFTLYPYPLLDDNTLKKLLSSFRFRDSPQSF